MVCFDIGSEAFTGNCNRWIKCGGGGQKNGRDGVTESEIDRAWKRDWEGSRYQWSDA